MRNLIRSGALLMLLLVAACATGPTLQASLASVPPVPAGEGRVFFYRGNLIFGIAIQPKIMLNGQKIGESIPGGVFYRDLPPGHYQVEVTTETTYDVGFELAAGQIVYLKTRGAMGGLEPLVVDPVIGKREAESLSLISGN